MPRLSNTRHKSPRSVASGALLSVHEFRASFNSFLTRHEQEVQELMEANDLLRNSLEIWQGTSTELLDNADEVEVDSLFCVDSPWTRQRRPSRVAASRVAAEEVRLAPPPLRLPEEFTMQDGSRDANSAGAFQRVGDADIFVGIDTPQEPPGRLIDSNEPMSRSSEFSDSQLACSTADVGVLRLVQRRGGQVWRGVSSRGSKVGRARIEDPRPLTRLEKFVTSSLFETLFCVVIMLNCVTMGMEAQVLVTGEDPGMKFFLRIAETIFIVIFTLELSLRIRVFGTQAFWPNTSDNRLNLFDAFLVFTGIVGWATFFIGADQSSVRIFTLFRATRLMRLVRVVSRIEAFHEVWLLLRGMSDSMRTLFWTVVVVFFLTYVFAVFGAVLMTKTLMNMREEVDPSERILLEEAISNIEDIGKIMRVLIQLLTLDSWNGMMEPILHFIYPAWMYFYAYIAIAVFVTMNLVTAIIVENALATSKQDEEKQIQSKEQAKQKELMKLRRLFVDMDADGDGTLSWHEFESAFENPALAKRWALLDYAREDCVGLFKLLDTGDGAIDTQEFFDGLMRMKGVAQSKDVFRIMKAQDNLQRKLGCILPSAPVSPKAMA